MAAEWFVGPVMEKLINSCSEYLEDQFRWQAGMKKELERLRENYPKIQAVFFAASQAHIIDQNPALNKWLWQLRDAIDEADDLLDEFEYMKHKERLARNIEETKVSSDITRFLLESARKLRKVGERALKIDPNLKRLEEVVQKLDKVSAKVDTFLHLLESTKQEQHKQEFQLYKTRETGSFPGNDLLGRGKEKEFVLQWLRQPSDEEYSTDITSTTLYNNISLLSIVGHGGMGKTTLLQHVYEDKMTKEFDLKMWVCVSNNFDVKRVITDMLESLKNKKPDLESLDALQRGLKSEVSFKKFLLVLDDIWEEENDKRRWENVLAPLSHGSLGSKILITTRMNSVASMIAKVVNKKKETLRLKSLEKDECLRLLNTHAFVDVENPGDHKKLKTISAKIVKKLLGSPLAAKVIGGVLNSNLDERHWITVLNSDFRSADLGQDDIFPILRLSYVFLPKHLQNCFKFCCIFPHDHKFNKDDLVRMWIAVGFIQPTYIRGETIEDIGGRYFDILVKKSFFDEFENRSHYKMHDLLHHLAQSISTQECFRVVGDEELFFTVPETIRHLSVKTNNIEVLAKMGKLKNLRSLFLYYEENDQDLVNVLTEIFKASKSIRLLNIYAPYLEMIPEEIGYLIHLRYLKIDVIGFIKLPRSLSNLYHLQFIIYYEHLGYTGQLRSLRDDFLSREMNNLFNLHHLQLPWNDFSGMYGIGKLISLKELDGFSVKNENGYRIGEMEHMNELCQLRIKFLENVNDAKEACSVKLFDKKNLTNLSLEWSHIRCISDPYSDEKVLDNLQPYKNLKKLRIIGYMGVRSAIWMNKAHLISNIEHINLHGCSELQTFPPFGQLPFLKSLHLYNVPKVKRLENKFHENNKDCVFPSLEVLHILKLEALEGWFDTTAVSTIAADNCFFPCLTELYIRDCPNLQELPYLPPKLKRLMIYNIGWKTLNYCSISNSTPLETLVFFRCPNITYIPLADEVARLAALRYLTIRYCPNLISLGGHQEVKAAENRQLIFSKIEINDPSVLLMEPLRSITSLQKLSIERNDELVSFPIETEQWFLQVSSSLRELEFIGLKSLQSLPSSLERLSSLKFLCVHGVHQLQQLPKIPASLERLELHCLQSLQCLPSFSSIISSLKYLELTSIPLQELPCLLSLSFLHELRISNAPQLLKLSDLPPSLCELHLFKLNNLDCLPSCLPILSSLQKLYIGNVPQLRKLPNLPPSLCELKISDLNNLDCLPSSLPSLSSLQKLSIKNVPRLWKLPDLPPSLEHLEINKCHPELMERCEKFSGLDWHKIAHTHFVFIKNE